MQKPRQLIFLLILLSFSNLMFAHSKVNSSIPENAAILSKAPELIKLSFSDKIRLTRISIQVNSTDPIDLDISDFNNFENQFSIQNPLLEKGFYEISWRGLGIDGHTMQGSFNFTVN